MEKIVDKTKISLAQKNRSNCLKLIFFHLKNMQSSVEKEIRFKKAMLYSGETKFTEKTLSRNKICPKFFTLALFSDLLMLIRIFNVP